MPEQRPKPFSMFQINQSVNISRVGKKVLVKGIDGTFQDTDSVEANLLYEILIEMRKQNRK